MTRTGRWAAGALVGVGATFALAAPASAQVAESTVVPQTAGMMGAVEAPAPDDDSRLPLVFQAGGAVLLAAGAAVAARSWVSTATAG